VFACAGKTAVALVECSETQGRGISKFLVAAGRMLAITPMILVTQPAMVRVSHQLSLPLVPPIPHP